jgi:hypothetical protein
MRSSTRFVTCLGAAAIVALGCREPTSPQSSWLVVIQDIDLPSLVDIADTVRISFNYEASCGPRTLEIVQDAERVEISARAAPFGGLCTAGISFQRAQVVLFPYQRAETVTVIFRQPAGADSVRTITSTYVVASAP